ncbi:hypothetical protein ACFQV2_15945 [Actinokineospora soli]|uniref:Uncharacterized protein n=1 Tax=Actinokineospora soli TaxID=1048753 RepID=A0ABW2TNR0_9PSEU
MFPDWLPTRGLEALLAAGRSALPVPTTPAGVLEAAVRMAAARLRGKVVTLRAADRDVPMTVVDLAVSSDTVGLAQGRVGEVLFAARDVAWPDLPLHRLAVECRDVRFAGPLSPRVVVGAVRVRAALSAEAVAGAVAAADPGCRRGSTATRCGCGGGRGRARCGWRPRSTTAGYGCGRWRPGWAGSRWRCPARRSMSRWSCRRACGSRPSRSPAPGSTSRRRRWTGGTGCPGRRWGNWCRC